MSDAPANEPAEETEVPDPWDGVRDAESDEPDDETSDDDEPDETDDSDSDGGTEDAEPRRFIDPDSVDE